MSSNRTQVCIIGGGPSGLLLSQLLYKIGVDSIILERQTRDHVLGRIRAGVLEQGMCNLMEEAGIGTRLRKEGFEHNGTLISYGQETFRIDFTKHTNTPVIVYGQTEVTRDLYEAREKAGGKIEFKVENVVLNDLESKAPFVTYKSGGQSKRIDCDFIAGCDGFRGVSRKSIPDAVRKEYEKVYPFGWLGMLSQTPPVDHELIYSNSDRGFALCSMRNENLSRYYLQCPASDKAENWSDEAFWQELRMRIPEETAEKLITGNSVEKSIAPLRSFVTEPMRWGALFLCGDAAHIVPPTGAKGLNTAASDTDIQNERWTRVWKVERFSWWFSMLMHQFPTDSPFDRKMQIAELEFLRDNDAAQQAMAQNYVGLPY
ncbi:p-hydroxybenzoate hydroxylase [Nymphon striatum]|nr:p-hydroxybenzoate hydroxylase [Nymphon striatum]